MRKPEQKLWDRLKRNNTIPGDVMRVENKTCDGTPDLNSCYSGNEFWVELKVGRRSQLKRLFKRSQPPWHLRRVIQGGTVFVLLEEPGQHYVLYRVTFAKKFEDRYVVIFETNKLKAITDTLIVSIIEV